MQELLHSLGINWGVMLAQIVNFTILLLVLAKFVYKPVMRLLDERRDKIAAAEKHGQEIAKQMEVLEQDREKVLSEARLESGRMIEEAKKSGEEARKRILAEAEMEVLKMRKEGEKRLAADKQRLLQEVKREIGGLVIETIEKGLSDALDAKSQGRMVEQALAALRETEKGEVRKNH
ncbi:MAG: F0F1 ATP synthase subunit B [bacterium]|nr:F0F1 ATP synthase subunit B [bacterium]